jgi:hypothetical protein
VATIIPVAVIWPIKKLYGGEITDRSSERAAYKELSSPMNRPRYCGGVNSPRNDFAEAPAVPEPRPNAESTFVLKLEIAVSPVRYLPPMNVARFFAVAVTHAPMTIMMFAQNMETRRPYLSGRIADV